MGKVLHASESGFFPFCITENQSAEIGPGSLYPIGMTLDEAVYLFWVVKKWKVQDNYGLLSPSLQPTTFYNDNYFYQFTKEEELVCFSQYYDFIYSNNDSTIQFGYFAPYLTPAPDQFIIKRNGLYYPFFSIDGLATISPGEITGGLSNKAGLDSPVEVGTATILFGGITKTTPLYGYDFYLPYSATITATEYWSYGGTWNISTGQLLT